MCGRPAAAVNLQGVRAADFFEEHVDPADELFGPGTSTPSLGFRQEFVRALRVGPQEVPDAEVGAGLARLVHDDLESYGTSGDPQLSEGDLRDALLALRAVLQRLAVDVPDIPFRDFTSFRSYWLREGASGSWQARRDILDGIFTALHDDLADLESGLLTASLADAVSPRGRTGWTRVDEELAELRRHFQHARTPQDYRNVGNDCVVVLETLSRQVYDVSRHLRAGETEPPIGKTKQRLERFVEDAAAGPENVEMRKLLRAAIDMAQAVKHTAGSTRRSAGIAADATILLANLLRRLGD